MLTGNIEKLEKVGKTAHACGNLAARIQISMYLGDLKGRIPVLRDCSQVAMAKRTVKSNGITKKLEELGGVFDSDVTMDPS